MTFSELAMESERHAEILRAVPEWRRGALVRLPVRGEDFFPKLLAVWNSYGVAVPTRGGDSEEGDRTTVPVDFVWDEERPRSIGSGKELPSSLWHAIHCTSGSTGRPRAIVRGWRQALYEAAQYASLLALREGMDCTMLIHPSFGASTKHFLGCLLSGCKQYVPSVTGMTPRGGDLLYGTPSQILARESELFSKRCFDLISLTGEPCSSKGWKVIRSLASPGAKCLNALGGTETGVLINSFSDIHSPGSEPWEMCGTALPGKCLQVVGDDGFPVPAGSPGRLLVESEWIAEGLLEQESVGEVGFHPFEHKGTARLFLTGDVVLEEEGRFRHLGRSGSMIKHRGEWLDTAPLLSALDGEGVDEFHLDRSVEGAGLRVWIRMECPGREVLKRMATRLVHCLGESPLLPEVLLAIGEFPLNEHGKKDLGKLSKCYGTDEVLVERIPSLAKIQAEAIAGKQWHSSSLKGALTVGDLNLDSLSLHELILELELLTGRVIPPHGISPATSIAGLLGGTLDSSHAFARLGNEEKERVLLWLGDGVIGIHHELKDQIRILHWDITHFPGAGNTAGSQSLRELAERMIAMAEPADLQGRVVIGGFSAGAVLAHEMSLVLRDRGAIPAGLLLLDPPDLDYRPIRSPWRWSRWRPSFLVRLLGFLPKRILETWGGQLHRLRAAESIRHLRERRRSLMRGYMPPLTSIPALLATSGSHHEGAVRFFGHVSEGIEILPLGVHEHLEIISDPAARSAWISRLKTMLQLP